MSDGRVRYEGACHCGAVRFVLLCEPITAATRCNCSICRRKNGLMSQVYYPRDQFELTQGDDALSVYRFAPNKVNHYFCKHCGIPPFHDAVDQPELGVRVNMGCIDEIDAHALPVRVFDGKDTWKFLD